ncbi:hypothetical protein QOZ80_9AG0692470 [Eleusine coracana subsp. coracana]|nr:hypothetical protein QOZ80_9AG0692470 [Eleusine coracana subsp. coracana]
MNMQSLNHISGMGTEKGTSSVHGGRSRTTSSSPTTNNVTRKSSDGGGVSSMRAADDHRFILDSGASVHATGDHRILDVLDHPAHVTAYFRRRDGKDLPVAGTGSIIIASSDDAGGGFRLTGVQYVPELGPGVTLVSVPQLAASGLVVTFYGRVCYVADANRGVVEKGRLHEDDGFYHLEFLRVPAPGVVQLFQHQQEGNN